MSKEAVVFVLDVGESMWQTRSEEDGSLTLLDKAIKCTTLMQSQKIIDGRKTDQVALVVVNTPATENTLASGADEGYGNISVAQPFDCAKYDMIRYMHESLPLGGAESSQADPVEAVVVAADLLITLTKGKAFGVRRIIYLSDWSGAVPSDTGMADIVDQLRGNGITLDLVRVSDNQNDDESALGAFMREQLVDPLDGQVYGIDEALGMLAEYGSKRSRQVATFKGTLDIAASDDGDGDGEGRGLRIPVAVYGRTAPGKLPVAKKVSAGEQVERSLEYRRANIGLEDDDDDDGDGGKVQPVIAKEQLIKAYRYGKSLVPFSKIDTEELGYKSEKCLTALGFIPTTSLPHALLMTTVWQVEAEAGNTAAGTAMTALVQACYERGAAVLGRYVRAKGGSPRLVALLPKIKPSYAAFLMVGLPFSDDLRRFTFPSLANLPPPLQPSPHQLSLMKELIGAMKLGDDDLKPSATRNPSNQRLVQCILARITSPADPVPPIDPAIIAHITPSHILEAAAPSLAAVRAAFELRPVQKWKHAEITRFWDVETQQVAVADEHVSPNMEKDVDGKAAPEPIRSVSEEKPIEDFEAMVSDRHHDLVVPAFKQLMALIPRLALSPSTTSLALDCLASLRKAAIREDEHDLFNAYLQELKRAALSSGAAEENPAATSLWSALQPLKDTLTLISSAENPSSAISPDHASTFYHG